MYYVSEMDGSADALARKYGFGLETISFCIPENMENESFLREKSAQFEGIRRLSLHAPYYELFPSAIDPMIRGVAVHRFNQALKTCERLGIKRMIVHSGFAPQIYYPEWFVPKSIEFWREFTACLPDGFELMIENVLDTNPVYLRDVCDGIADERVKICLDIGHANTYSDIAAAEWIDCFGGRIGHVHLHNNHGLRDEHRALDKGTIDMITVLERIKEHAPDADICIESMDAMACVDWLKEKGYIDV